MKGKVTNRFDNHKIVKKKKKKTGQIITLSKKKYVKRSREPESQS